MGFSKWLVAAALLPVSCAAQTPEDEFAKDMVSRIAKLMPDSVITSSANDPFEINEIKDGKQNHQFYVGRIFGYCQNTSPSECEAAKQEFAEKTVKTPPRITASSLRLSVRDQQYIDGVLRLETDADADAKMALFKPIGDDLYAILVADSADTVQLVGTSGLESLGMKQEEAWARAAAQTRSRLPELPDPKKLKTAAFAFQDQEYLASMLIDLKQWSKIAQTVGDDMFMTVVADNFVFVGTMPDGPSLENFRKTVAEDCAGQQRCVSPNLYRFRNGGWVVAP